MAVLEAPPAVQPQSEPRPLPPPESAGPKPYRWRWAALAVLISGNAMELLDISVTGVAGPTMRADLGGSPGMIQWLTAAYTLAMVGGLLVGARLGDILGRKRMFLIGAGGFTFASLLVAVAASPETAITARVVQGLFGAAMVPQVMALIKDMFPPRETGKAFGLLGPIMGAAAIGGPSLAGWLLGADLFGTGWRMIFLINLPIGLAVIALAVRLVPGNRPARSTRLDVPGAVLASIASLLLVYPLVQGRESGWPAWAFIMIIASVLGFAGFAWYETRKAARGGDPLVLPSLFRKRAFNGGLILGMLLLAAMVGMSLVMTLYLQVGLGFSPLRAATTMIPYAVAMGATMGFLDKLARFGRRTLLAGALIKATGLGAMMLTLELAGAGLAWWHLVPALMVSGAGAALFMGRYFESVLSAADPHEIGSAAGALTSVQQLGSSFGVALLGTVFFGRYAGDMESLLDAARAALGIAVAMLVVSFFVGFTLPKRS